MMKNNSLDIKSLLLALLFLPSLFFVGCDNIDDDDRVKDVDKSSITKTVLLEDFTGVNCINCPEAHKAAAKSQSIIGENLVVVSIHAGMFSTAKFRTEAGNAYREYFYSNDGDGYPAGMISRTRFDGSVTSVNYSKWNTYILERLSQSYSMDVDIALKVNYSVENNSFIVESSVTPQSEIQNVKLQLWITESNIISSQKSTEGTISDYEHNHVLRDAINGIWGEDIDNNIDPETTKTYTSNPYSLQGKDWDPKNLSIVGFLYDNDTKEVLDVKEIKLINQ